jgi:hypothetical protein
VLNPDGRLPAAQWRFCLNSRFRRSVAARLPVR